MAKTRITKKVINAVSDEQFNDAMATVAANDAKRQKIVARMDEQITAIRDKYADGLKDLEEGSRSAAEVVETYCTENPQLFIEKKSYETPHGTVGFRTGNPKLMLLKGIKGTQALDNLKRYLPDYVRVTEEPAKDRLLADRNTELVQENLSKVGFQVVQDESFFIELKKEEGALV